MSSVHILFTFDYEIFGNGSGDLKACVVEPTQRILRLIEDHGIRSTIFVDVCLLWAVYGNERKNRFKGWHYSPTQLLEDHLRQIHSRGHDIQLHAHPQLIGASYKNGKFIVDDRYWRICDLPLDADGQTRLSIRAILREGKRTLEQIIRKQDPNYSVLAFRAGGLCARPEQNLLRAMREQGFKVDSSTAFAFRIATGAGMVDYTNVFKTPDPVFVGESFLDQRAQGTLLTIPIYGAKYYWWSEFGRRLRRRLSRAGPKESWRKTRPCGCKGSAWTPGYQNPRRGGFFESHFKTVTKNYYLEDSVDGMIWCTRDAFRRASGAHKDVYMVGIGHPKAMGDLSQLETYLKWLSRHPLREKVVFFRMADLVDRQFPSYTKPSPPPFSEAFTAGKAAA